MRLEETSGQNAVRQDMLQGMMTPGVYIYIYVCIYIYIYIYAITPVVPHKAVAEVSK